MKTCLQTTFAVLVAFLSASGLAAPQTPNVVSSEPRVEVEWLGGATMLLRFDGTTILTDPAFGEGAAAFTMLDPNASARADGALHQVAHRRLTPFPGIKVAEVNYTLVSHLHEDHFDQKAEASLPKTLPVVIPPADAKRLEEKKFTAGRPLDWGETLRIDTSNGQIEISALPAEHSPNPLVSGQLGRGNGYWLTFVRGGWQRSLYWTGDTFPTPRVIAAVQAKGRPDLLIGHVGGVGAGGMFGKISMGGAELRVLADQVKPATVLPIHHSTYALYQEPVWKVAEQFSGSPYRFNLLSEGSVLVLH